LSVLLGSEVVAGVVVLDGVLVAVDGISCCVLINIRLVSGRSGLVSNGSGLVSDGSWLVSNGSGLVHNGSGFVHNRGGSVHNRSGSRLVHYRGGFVHLRSGSITDRLNWLVGNRSWCVWSWSVGGGCGCSCGGGGRSCCSCSGVGWWGGSSVAATVACTAAGTCLQSSKEAGGLGFDEISPPVDGHTVAGLAVTEQDWNFAAGKEKIEIVQPTTQIDAFGNETKIKAPKKKLSRQEQKAKERRRKAKIAAGEPLSSDDEDDL